MTMGLKRTILPLVLASSWPPAAPPRTGPSGAVPTATAPPSETGLISTWSPTTLENVVFRIPHVGRSTPAVFDGRVCASGRADSRYETIACWSAKDGAKLWERRFVVHNTTIPFSRVGLGQRFGRPRDRVPLRPERRRPARRLRSRGQDGLADPPRRRDGPQFRLRRSDPLAPDRRRFADRQHRGRVLGRAGAAASALRLARQAHGQGRMGLDTFRGGGRRLQQPGQRHRGPDRWRTPAGGRRRRRLDLRHSRAHRRARLELTVSRPARSTRRSPSATASSTPTRETSRSRAVSWAR